LTHSGPPERPALDKDEPAAVQSAIDRADPSAKAGILARLGALGGRDCRCGSVRHLWLDRSVAATPPRNRRGPDRIGVRAARRYAHILARHRVRLGIRNSAGAVEDLELLREPASGVQAADRHRSGELVPEDCVDLQQFSAASRRFQCLPKRRNGVFVAIVLSVDLFD